MMNWLVPKLWAVAAWGICSDDLLNNLNPFYFLFETLCVRDLRVFANVLIMVQYIIIEIR